MEDKWYVKYVRKKSISLTLALIIYISIAISPQKTPRQKWRNLENYLERINSYLNLFLKHLEKEDYNEAMKVITKFVEKPLNNLIRKYGETRYFGDLTSNLGVCKRRTKEIKAQIMLESLE